MRISHRIEDGVYFLRVSGNLVISEMKSVRQYLDQSLEELSGIRAVIFDFEEVKHFDSSGLGFIAGMFKQLRTSNIPLLLCNLNSVNQKIYRATGMDEHIPLYPSRKAALDTLVSVKNKFPIPS